MGMHRIAELETRIDTGFNHVAVEGKAELWTRGGEEGLVVRFGEVEAWIPHEMLVEHVGLALRSKAARRIEGMRGTEFIQGLL